jgi:hypothetical protein
MLNMDKGVHNKVDDVNNRKKVIQGMVSQNADGTNPFDNVR